MFSNRKVPLWSKGCEMEDVVKIKGIKQGTFDKIKGLHCHGIIKR